MLKKRVLGLEYAVVVATRVEGLEIAIVSPCGKGCDQRVDGKQYRKLHCLAMAASRNSSREQSNCVDRVARIFEMVRSFCHNFETSKAECGKVLVTSTDSATCRETTQSSCQPLRDIVGSANDLLVLSTANHAKELKMDMPI